MIYFIVTTSLYINSLIRKNQYIRGITTLKKSIKDSNIKNYKIIIIENNGLEKSFLDEFGEDVFYTNNNFLKTNNKGYKELQDVRDTIDKFGIKDNDFIVKMTGRYFLKEKSEFIDVLKNIHNTKYDCIIKYGSYINPVNYKTNDCITGLIGMSCYYVKKIVKPTPTECVEWKWAICTQSIPYPNIYLVNQLGINICPSGNTYFEV